MSSAEQRTLDSSVISYDQETVDLKNKLMVSQLKYSRNHQGPSAVEP
jgi:hypothetical protein